LRSEIEGHIGEVVAKPQLSKEAAEGVAAADSRHREVSVADVDASSEA
jgi:hypothetical protein